MFYQSRSEIMQRIRARGNKTTELSLARLLKRSHITGWRRHAPLPGTPDFVFRKERVVVFVDGCFWHGCSKHSKHVQNSGEFWIGKIGRNRRRDRQITRELKSRGWRVVRIWEHDLGKGREA